MSRNEWASKPNLFVCKAALIVGMGGFVYGYDFGVVAGTLTRLKEEFDLDSSELGLVVSSLPVGCIFACFFGGSLCDSLGRWWTIVAQNIVYAMGSVVMYSATTIMHIYIGRFLVGVGIALSCIANVPYLLEVSPSHARGKVSSAFEFLAAVGLLVSYCINLLVYHIQADWRLLFIIPGCISLGQACSMKLLPESPNWLLQNNKEDECRKALTFIYDNDSDISEKFHEIKKTMPSTSSSSTSKKTVGFIEVAIQYKWIVAMMMTLIAFQQFSGAFVLRYYALDLYRNAGFGEERSLELTILLGVVKVFSVGTSLCYMDSIGRKFLLMLSTGLVAVGYAVLFVAFLHGKGTDAWFWYSGGGALIIGGYGVGLGPVLRLMESECFPSSIRGRIMAVCVIVRYACEFVVNMFFVSVVDLTSEREAFMTFYVFCILAMIFVYFFVIETRQKEPHEILAEFYRLSGGGGEEGALLLQGNKETELSP